MKNAILSICLSFVLALLSGCGSRQSAFEPRAFPFLKVPSAILDSGDKARYVSYYFWDDFTDTTAIFHSDSSCLNGVDMREIEKNFAIWVSSLEAVNLRYSSKSVERMFERTVTFEKKDSTSNMLEKMSFLVGKYLYDPNSPYRNEDIYGKFASLMSSCDVIPQEKRDIYLYEAEMCSLNSVGSPAADFIFSDSKGKRHSLYDINAEYILLFFSNPGCEACRQIVSVLCCNEKFSSLVSTGRLAVLNMYIDEDIEAWRSHLCDYPENWNNGFDSDYVIRTDLIYNVRAIPSLYLLDRYKRVVLKDVPESRLLDFLENLE